MANVKFQAPNPYSQQAADLNRRQKMAEMLQQQSMEPLQQQSAGGMVIPLNPLAGLAKVLQSYTSSRQLSDLDKKRAGLEAEDMQRAREMFDQFRPTQTVTPPTDAPMAAPNTFGSSEGGTLNKSFFDNIIKNATPNNAPSINENNPYQAPVPSSPQGTSLEDRKRQLIIDSIGAGPHALRMAEMLYNEKPEAIAPLFSVGQQGDYTEESVSKALQAQQSGDKNSRRFLVVKPKQDMTPYQAARLAQIDAAAKAPRPAVNLQKGPAYKLVSGEIRESVFNPQTGQSFFSNAEGGLVKIPENATLVRADPERLRNLPATIATALLTNTASLNQLDRALKLNAGETITLPDGEVIVGDKDAVGAKGYTPQDILNRTDPKGISTRAEIANIGSMIIHDRSGAAVTASEAPRLKPFIPLITDNNETVKKKLTLLRAAIRDEDSSLRSIYSEDQGYRPFSGDAQRVPDGFVIERQ